MNKKTIKILKKCITVSTQILSSTKFFNIDNNQKYLEQQIGIL